MRNVLPLREQLRPGELLDRVLPERPDMRPMPTDVIEESATDMVAAVGERVPVIDLPDMSPHDGEITGAARGDQVPARGRSDVPDAPDLPTGEDGDGYLRLRVAVTHGQATVTTASRVDGPLVTAEAATGGYVWEVTLDDDVLSSDALGDLSTRRSFPDPEAAATDPRHGHHLTELTSFEFTVRVPLERLPADALERAQIGLYRVKDASRPLALRAARRTLKEHFGSELREVARVPSLDEGAVGREVAEGIRRIVGR